MYMCVFNIRPYKQLDICQKFVVQCYSNQNFVIISSIMFYMHTCVCVCVCVLCVCVCVCVCVVCVCVCVCVCVLCIVTHCHALL